MRTLSERKAEINKDIYVCFIEYPEAFDEMRHEEITRMMENFNIYGNDLRINNIYWINMHTKNIYWIQYAVLKIGNPVGQCQPIKRVYERDVYCLQTFCTYIVNIL